MTPDEQHRIDEYAALVLEDMVRQYNAPGGASEQIDLFLTGKLDIPSLRKYQTVGQINCEADKSHCFHRMPRIPNHEWRAVCCHCGTVREPMEVNIPGRGPHGAYKDMR